MIQEAHSHNFGQDIKTPGETRTIWVVGITFSMMLVEVTSGIIYGSMALLADGIHMASHTSALLINLGAYFFARKWAHDRRFNFGTGKINALGGFTGGVLLMVFSLIMAWESVLHWLNPRTIHFNQAIFVAVLGLLVNGFCALLLNQNSQSHPEHKGAHDNHHSHHHHHHDHNLKSAYLHVLADALTSVLAIMALLTAKYMGAAWMDPLMGIVGSLLVIRWSVGLLKNTSADLLDMRPSENLEQEISQSLTDKGDIFIQDLHVWSVGPGLYSVILSVRDANPKAPEYYRHALPKGLGLVHSTIEVV